MDNFAREFKLFYKCGIYIKICKTSSVMRI